MTLSPRWWQIAKAACSSLSVKNECQWRSHDGPMIPPVRLSLMWSTPAWMCSRMVRTNPSGPSHGRAKPVPRAWPAVVVRNQPHVERRGPTCCPESNARLSATSMKCGVPAMRSPVTPASRSARCALARYCAVSSGTPACEIRGHSRCTCASQSPGSRYAPRRSMTCAPRVVGERLPSRTSTMRSFSIVTLAPAVTPGVIASMRFALVRTRRAVAAMAQEPSTLSRPSRA